MMVEGIDAVMWWWMISPEIDCDCYAVRFDREIGCYCWSFRWDFHWIHFWKEPPQIHFWNVPRQIHFGNDFLQLVLIRRGRGNDRRCGGWNWLSWL